jgi:DNA invertase Pin-like site-specific DNA recombinase
MKGTQKHPKFRRPYKDKPYTSPIKRAEVVGLHLAHKTRTEIATLTGLNRQTVSRILSQSEVETLYFPCRVQKPGFSLMILVDERGFEPPASSLRTVGKIS